MYENIKTRLSSLGSSAQSRNMGEYGGFDRADEFEPSAHVRLLSFNIQVGISTASYRHYSPAAGSTSCPITSASPIWTELLVCCASSMWLRYRSVMAVVCVVVLLTRFSILPSVAVIHS